MSDTVSNSQGFNSRGFNFQECDPKAFGKVAVLYGGSSAEREVSLKSGQAVYEALSSAGVDVCLIDSKDRLYDQLKEHKVERVFIAVHGRGGEDGSLQGFLEHLDLPYTGSGVKASALAMDKYLTKLIWEQKGLVTPAFFGITDKSQCAEVEARVGFPVMVKPSHEGSSVGITRAEDLSELEAAYENASTYDSLVLIEQWVSGKEFTVSIVDNDVLPSIGLETDRDFYDFEAKYLVNDTKYLLPSGLPEEKEQEIRDLALQAYQAVGCEGWGRVDFMQDQEGKFYLIEVNTVPGMTDHSLVPMAAAAVGMNFKNLVLKLLSTTL